MFVIWINRFLAHYSIISEPEELPPLLEGCQPLLNQTEFVPDFDVPTNESYSSIIDEFSLPGTL